MTPTIERVPVSTSIAFERLSKTLEEAKKMPRGEAILLLRDAAEMIEPHSELMRWFLHEVDAIVSEEDGA